MFYVPGFLVWVFVTCVLFPIGDDDGSLGVTSPYFFVLFCIEKAIKRLMNSL